MKNAFSLESSWGKRPIQTHTGAPRVWAHFASVFRRKNGVLPRFFTGKVTSESKNENSLLKLCTKWANMEQCLCQRGDGFPRHCLPRAHQPRKSISRESESSCTRVGHAADYVFGKLFRIVELIVGWFVEEFQDFLARNLESKLETSF